MVKTMCQANFLSISFFFAVILLIYPLSANASELTTSVDRTTISIQDTLNLTVELNEQALMSEPDFSELNKNFQILSTSKSSNINYVNGNYHGVTKWDFQLSAKKSGVLTIPSFKFNKLKSKAINITVTDSPSQALNTQSFEDIFVETSVDKKSAYIQEQVFFTVKLFHQSQQINNWSMTEPEIKDAFLIRYEEPKQYYTMLDGIRYGVLEKSYLIFPEKSGSLVLPSIRFNGVVSKPNSSRSRFNFNQGRRVVRDSNSIELTIKPIPESFTGKTWLPASNVTIDEAWSPDKKQLKVGEPITRTITLKAKGSMGSLLPGINANFPKSIKQYPDQADISDTLEPEGVSGTRIESIALIPLEEEDLKLPAIRLAWWDIDEDKLKYAFLASNNFSVSAADIPATQSPAPTPLNADSIQQKPYSKGISQDTADSLNTWKITSLLSLLMNIALLLAVVYLWISRTSKDDTSTSQHNNTEISDASQLKASLKLLFNACSENNAKAARQALIAWAQVYFDDRSLYSLDSIILKFNNKELRKRIRQLENSLYGQTSAKNWKGQKLSDSIRAVPIKPKKENKKNKELPDLYPISS